MGRSRKEFLRGNVDFPFRADAFLRASAEPLRRCAPAGSRQRRNKLFLHMSRYSQVPAGSSAKGESEHPLPIV